MAIKIPYAWAMGREPGAGLMRELQTRCGRDSPSPRSFLGDLEATVHSEIT